MAKIKFNLLLAGQSGSGKSSFANYLLQQDIFNSGAGKPVTQWSDNLQAFSFNQGNSEITVYDTVGIEPDNYPQWQSEINKFIDQKNIENYVIKPDQFDHNKYENIDVLHGLFYIINCKSDRLQDVEISALKNFIAGRIPVYVILTNADTNNTAKIDGLKQSLAQHVSPDLSVHCVVSVDVKKRGGVNVEKSGRQSVIDDFMQPAMKISNLAVIRDLYNTTYIYENKVNQILDELHDGVSEHSIEQLIKNADTMVNDSKNDIMDFTNKVMAVKEFFQTMNPDADHSQYFNKLDELNQFIEQTMNGGLMKFDELKNKIPAQGLTGIMAMMAKPAIRNGLQKFKQQDEIGTICQDIRAKIIKIENMIQNNN